MNKYAVIITVDASVCVEVEAENEEQAKELALNKVETPCLCHQCAREVQIGDILDAVEATLTNGGSHD